MHQWRLEDRQRLWRRHSDAVNGALITRWMPADRRRRVLKTDLFDEAVADGLYPPLASRAKEIVGVDKSLAAVSAAKRQHGCLQCTVADVRWLPFEDGQFETVFSNSTLDHFRKADEIVISLRELHRVLCKEGRLILTLDNLANPFILTRNWLPFQLLNLVGIVPYYVGATMGPRGLRRVLEHVGFDVVELDAIMHCPRVLAVAIAGCLQRRAKTTTQRRFLGLLFRFEALSRWPTRFLTGHFVAVEARKI